MRKTAHSAMISGVLLLATACTHFAPSPVSESTASSEGGSAAYPISTVDTGSLPGLSLVTDGTGTSRSRQVYYNYPNVDGAPALNSALSSAVRSTVDAFTRDHKDAPTSATELNIQHTLLAYSGGIIGVRLDIQEFSGADYGTSGRTFWYDASTGKALRAAEILNGPAARRTLADAAARQLSAVPHLAAERLDGILAGKQPGLAALAFTKTGDLIAQFDDGAITSHAYGMLQVKIASAEVVSLLNDTGQRARAQVMAPASDLGFGMSPAPLPVPTVPGPPSAPPRPSPVNCANAKCVALTFDDGPSSVTPRLLDTLNKYDVKATFFMTGTNVSKYASTAARAAGQGHETANHTQDHKDLTRLTPAGVREQVNKSAAAIERATGIRPTMLRPPYGATNDTVRAAANAPLILWDVDTLDWKSKDTTSVKDIALTNTRPGSIILMHDLYGTTVDAVPAIIEGLRAKGYTLVTVSDLFSRKPFANGQSYSSAR
ncbi:Peptidoglycan/xylan/chitin deacetylase, PgdA/CDA1 family [Streptomyces sp. TLI_053]|uniref:polysaccharide deacetylase family protein n=1 Tax=Streptomyces sp. TLI_053 TaxID=1855352 RepID=UPI00087A4C73|nr:polysaccharide deacetylase family protein [Streptomyces sp. TLI_053]SDT82719.1 Peptidoglycan/xylan/chitin deacetylase, PgdA/CDA1 family [Streptomyces sp. TLI_053]